jgi:ribosomal protein S18 acetylase RimI-like enzyme
VSLTAPAPLTDGHETSEFNSGQTTLDEWLKRRARANQASGASRTFVVCDGARVVGYYSLASSSIASNEATGRFRRNMPDPVPVVVLGRLAIDVAYQRRGLGRAMVRDAAKRVLAAGEEIGIRGLIVHALSDEAKAFYLEMGFLQSPLNEMTLMIPLSDLRENL